MDHKSELPSSADFDRIEAGLFDRIDARHRRQILRHRLVATAAVLVLAGAGVAAGTTANSTQQTKLAYCYGGSTTSSHVAQLAVNDRAKPGSKSTAGVTDARVADAVAVCAAAWRGGVFNKSSHSAPFLVPKLQACVRNDLSLSVFRQGNASVSAAAFCNSLGLSAP